MFKVEDGVVYITRGDDAELEVSITDSAGATYIKQKGRTKSPAFIFYLNPSQ